MLKKRCILMLVIIVITVIYLAGCGDTADETADAIDPIVQIMREDIDSIGEVTVDDEVLIYKLIDRYGALSDVQKEQVSNYASLLSAKEKLETLKKEVALVEEESKQEEKTVEVEKDPWDLTGSWCEDSVEKGEPGMAAYFTKDEMKVYFVSDNPAIYTPYMFGTYEVVDGENSFSWVSQNDMSNETDYPFYSYSETKDFSYENGIITFIQKSKEEENTIRLHRTQLDFSSTNQKDVGIAAKTISFGLYEYIIPKSFGYLMENTNDSTTMLTYISQEAMLRIAKGAEIDGWEKVTDKELSNQFNRMNQESKNDFLKDYKGSELVEENNEPIADGLGYTCHITGINNDGMDGDVYFAHFCNKYSKTFYMVYYYVSHKASYDYGADFNEMISNIKPSGELKKSAALASLKVENDEIEQTTYYKPLKYPEYRDSRTFVLPYIITDGNDLSLHLVMDYYGNDWVFYDKVIFAVDDERHEISIPMDRKMTDISNSGKVVELTDLGSLSPADIGMLRRISDSEKTIVRFDGGTNKYDYTLTEEDKKGFADIFNAYDVLKYNQ